VPDHAIGDGQRYRGDGGTIHTGVGQVGDDDENAAAREHLRPTGAPHVTALLSLPGNKF